MPPREEYLRSPTRSNHSHHHRGHHRNAVALSPSSLSSSSLSPQQQEDRRRLRRRSSSMLSRGKSVVSFSDNSEVDVEVQEVRHWKDYTPDEKASVWYSQSEYQQFKDDCKDSIDAYTILNSSSSYSNKGEEENNINTAVRENDDHDHDHDQLSSCDVCTRGIERMTKECSCDYHHRRIEILKKVRWFKYSGRLDSSIRPDAREQQEELLAGIVNQLTTTSVLEAQDRAKKDEEFAFEYLKKESSSGIIMEKRSSGTSTLQISHTSSTSTGTKMATTVPRRSTSLHKNINKATSLTVSIPEEGATANYYCALPVLSPAKKKRSDSPNYVKSKRKMRAHAGRLFREESLQRLSFEGL